MTRLWPLYGAKFGVILRNKPLYRLIFSSNGIGRFYGRIFVRLAISALPAFAESRPGASSDPRWACSVRVLFMGGIAMRPVSPWGTGGARRGLEYRENTLLYIVSELFLAQNLFGPGNFTAFRISISKHPARTRFRAKIFPAWEILQPKSTGFPIPLLKP